MKEKEFVENLYNESAKSDRNTKSLAHDLSDTIAESLSGAKYVNELLQNADDSGIHVPHPIAVEFIITQNYLIFKHNGKHFDEKDVDGISDIAGRNRDKINELQAIGHKGRGFKAVFNIANYVLIISSKWQFRFDKSHELWEDHPEDYPWQMIPIWTEKQYYPAEIIKHIDDESVNFIFQIQEPALRTRIIGQINEYLKNPNLMLFLKHTKSLSVNNIATNQINTIQFQEELLEEIDNIKIKKISATSNQQSYFWYICQAEILVKKDIAEKLKNAKHIPAKYKNLTDEKIPIAIATGYNNLGLLKAEFPQVFCYLSTEISLNFPFLINAEFFLEPARANFQGTEIATVWNVYLLENIFYWQFRLAEYIGVKSEHWKNVVNLICGPSEIQLGSLIKYSDKFTKSFNKALDKFAFVTNMSNNEVRVVTGITIDFDGFVEHFGLITLKVETVHPEVKNQEKLKSLGAKNYSIEKILDEIEKVEFLETLKDPTKSKDFMIFLYNLYQKHGQDKKTGDLIINRLKSIPFILSSENKLHKVDTIFFPDDALKYCIHGYDYIYLVHPVINALENKVKEWLYSFGLNNINLGIVVKQVNDHPNDLLSFTKKVYQRHQQGKLEKPDYSALSALKLITKNKTQAIASSCYLPSGYNPEVELEKSLKEHIYVSLKYSAPEEPSSWKQFFILIGVSETIHSKNISSIISTANKRKETLFSFTRLLFGLFSTLDEQTKNQLIKLSLVTTNDEIKENKNFYLSNFYSPKMPIQDKIENLFYLSAKYVLKDEDIRKWRNFFVALGIRQTLEVKVVEITGVIQLETKHPWAKKYLSYLQERKYEDDPISGTELAPSKTFGYRNQHTLSFFADIEYLDFIIDTPVFWLIIKSGLETIQDSIERVIYKTVMSSREVPSCIQYYVNLAINNRYHCNCSDMYSPKLIEILDDGDRVATIASELSDEQLKFFGFKLTLSIDDCIHLLNKFSESTCTQEVYNKIVTIYQHLYENLKDVSRSVLPQSAGLKVFSQSGEFIPANQLFYLATDLPLPRSKSSIKKPESIENKQFELICFSLGLTCIHENELAINSSNKELTKDLHDNILRKIHFIALIESYKNDILPSEIQSFVGKFIEKFTSQLYLLSIYYVDKIELSYTHFYHQELPYWFDKKNIALYLIRKHDPFLLKNISELLVEYFELKIKADDLWLLLISDEQKIKSHFMEYNLTETNIEKALKIKDSMPLTLEEQKSNSDSKDIANDDMELDDYKPIAKQNQDVEIVEIEDLSEKETANQHRDTPKDTVKDTVPTQTTTVSSGSSSFGLFSSRQPMLSNLNSSAKTTSTISSSEPPAKKVKRSENNSKQLKLTDLSFTHLTQEDRLRIGYEGEKIIFDELKEKYIKKHGTDNVTETIDGLIINKPSYKKEIKWLNKNKDPKDPNTLSRELYDLEITVTYNEDTKKPAKKRYIEVKSTTATKKIEANFSEEEWNFMEKVKSTPNQKYTLFFITGLGNDKEKPKFRKIKDLNSEQAKTYNVKKVLMNV